MARTETQFTTRPQSHVALVWYESPFGPPEWMERSQADRLLAMELRKFQVARETVGCDMLWEPRILEREERLAELATTAGGPRGERP